MVATTSSSPRSIRRAGNHHDTEREDPVDETTALLAPSSRPTDAEPDQEEDKPLPKLQILLLCYARVIEPLAFFSIFPYVSQMVQDNGGVADADVGFYSGLIESLFSLTQAIIMIFWGRAADRFGRKPVLVFSLCGVTIATGLFGLAQTIPQMILFRCLAGVFAGTIVTIRTMVAEHSTSKTQARAFSWFAFSGNLGIFLGPLVGGSLADPGRQYPGIFGSVRFFAEYPYALSSLVVAMVGATAAISSALFVQETLPKPTPPVSTRSDEEEAGESAGSAIVRAELSTWDLLNAPGVGMVIYTYGHIMVLAFAYTAIVPVFWFTPPALGGYGFTPRQISLLMGLNGAAQAVWLLLVFPPLQKRLGSNGVIRRCAYAYPFFFLACPAGNVLLRAGTEAAVTVFWVFVPVTLVLGCGVSMSFTAIQLALNDIAPSPRVLGTLNALALTGVSGLRAFNPALFTTLFALGARSQWLGGYAIWGLMVVLALGLSVAARALPEPQEARKGDGRR
ncbi:MFS transporter [Aspergillus brunneoviolaceus CBS 621.78]|uniref:Permease of the major facilitator superfamily n=1 Tax=Aspergillus brunneoviolaceus CBS 621.78 TaxID=1450534 RepID=A0ACD1GK95_9EURO|nr:permease of the major facilitator superfamily [Aspergillus brunneoviolaceus CBS 621.78]RAH49754.1 permease of the major facilitator superfamily [Aspergillus brunneoviolaceus CBS 621.78]